MFQSCSARTGFTPCWMHLLLSVLETILLIRFSYVKSQSTASISNAKFCDHYKRKQSESFLSQPERTIWVLRHRTLRTQSLHLGIFLWKQYLILTSYKGFGKMQSFWLCTPLLTLTQSSFHAPAYWYCHLHKRLLPDEVFQWW